MNDDIDKTISEHMAMLSTRQELGCFKAGYKCEYVDSIKSLTRAVRNPNLICKICNRKKNGKSRTL